MGLRGIGCGWKLIVAAVIVSAIVLLIGVMVVITRSPPPPPVADKIILISVDTLRPDYLGCYNPSIHTTPTIDSLAQQGVLFEDAFCNYPKTTPSHASMLSGLYTWSHGVRENNQRIPDQVTLLPEILQAKGWSTGGFVSLITVKAIYGFDRGFDVFDDKLPDSISATGAERRCMETLEPALEWLSQHLDDKVFMFLHLGDPHGSYTPPEPYLKDLPPPADDQTLPIRKSNYAEDAIPSYQVINSHREVDFYIQRYHAEIRYVDDCLKQLLDKLKEWEIFDRTLIIFTSDHGEAMGEHKRWFQHGSSLYYAQTRVPLVIVFPRNKPVRVRKIVDGVDLDPAVLEHLGMEIPWNKPRRVQGIVESVDLVPTILEYLGMEVPSKMEGKSVLARLHDPDLPAKSFWYGHLNRNNMRGIERDGMKLVYSNKKPQCLLFDVRVRFAYGGLRKRVNKKPQYLLFDVRADPGEKENLADTHEDLKKTLDLELKGFIKTRRGLKAKRPRLSPEEKQKVKKSLRSLGYIE